MSKNIVHMKIPIIGEDHLALTPHVIRECAMGCRDLLPDEYEMLVSPFDVTMVDGDAKVINIDCKEYSYNELIEIIKKAEGSD